MTAPEWRALLRPGGHLAVTRWPGADAPRVVLVHSLGTDARIWQEVAPRLAQRAEVVSYDLRGHGLSAGGEITLASHVADLLALAGDVACVVGLSIGGLVALAAALERPDRVRSLVLADTAARIGTAERYAERILRIEDGGIAAIAEEQVARWSSKGVAGETAPLLRALICAQPQAGYIASARILAKADLRGRLSEVTVPALCLVGAEDVSTPPAMIRKLADALPNARYLEIAGAGHLPPLDAPTAMAEAILDHLACHA